MVFEGVYTQLEKSKTKDEFIQSLNDTIAENPIHCNFFELGAKVLQSINSPSILGISRVERTSSNVLVYAAMHRGMSLPDYLASLTSLSDKHFNEILKQILDGIVAIHSEGFYHQAINPNSFWVNEDGTIQLTLFETLEMRFCQQKPEGIKSEASLQEIQHYLSPERSQDLKILSFSDEYYSFGLIAWYIWCWKSGRLTLDSAQQHLPPFEATGTQWDKLIRACLHPTASSRPNSLAAIRALHSEIDNELSVDKVKKKKAIDVSKPGISEIALVIENYPSKAYQIFCNNRPITTFFQKIDGSTLTVNVPINALIEIYSTSNKAVLYSFDSSKRSKYTLPEQSIDEPEEVTSTKDTPNRASSLAWVVGALIIIIGFLIYLKMPHKTTPKFESVDGPSFAMIPPDGYVIIDTNYNDLLRNVGYMVGEEKWRYKEENWERFIPDESNSINSKWVKDNSQQVKLLDGFFEKIELIESEGISPRDLVLIQGNDSLLYKEGKQTLDGNFYRYVNNKWFRKNGERWGKLLSLDEYSNVQEMYFYDINSINQNNSEGFVVGENIKLRSEPSNNRNCKIIASFRDFDYVEYLQNEEANVDIESDDANNEDIREFAYVLKVIHEHDWILIKVKETGKVGWIHKDNFHM
jgi:serine/threonine protein kinase